jgi:hypothetical protein
MKATLLSLGILLFTTSCTTYHFTPLPDASTKVLHNRSRTLISHIDNTIGVVINPEYLKNELALQITLGNISNNTILVNDTDFSVYSSEDNVVWKEVKSYISRDYYEKAKVAYHVGTALTAFTAGLNSGLAGKGSAISSGSISGSTTGGSYTGNYQSTTSFYDPTAAELVRQRNQVNLESYIQNGQSWLSFLENNLFYSKDLQPNEFYFGLIFCEESDDKYLRVKLENNSIPLVVLNYVKEAD